MIYFLRAEQDSEVVQAGWIKIGTTTRLSSRLKQIAAEIGHTPAVLAILDGSYAEENVLHQKFDHAREWGEWFSPCDDLLRLIETEGKPWEGDAPVKFVRLDKGLIIKLKYLAARDGVTVSQLVNKWLRPLVDRNFRVATKELVDGIE